MSTGRSKNEAYHHTILKIQSPPTTASHAATEHLIFPLSNYFRPTCGMPDEPPLPFVAIEILEDGGRGVGRRLSDGRVMYPAIGLNLQVVSVSVSFAKVEHTDR
jgi:hypothetical protein